MPKDTKKQLSEAYLELLAEGGHQVATVKDVVNRAGVSRMTFYYHFQDIYDLVEWTYRDYLAKLNLLEMPVEEAWDTFIRTLFKMADENTLGFVDNYVHLDNQLLGRVFTSIIQDQITAFFETDDRLQRYNADDSQFLIQMSTYCIRGIVSSRVEHDLFFEPEDYIDKLNRLLRNSILEHRAL